LKFEQEAVEEVAAVEVGCWTPSNPEGGEGVEDLLPVEMVDGVVCWQRFKAEAEVEDLLPVEMADEVVCWQRFKAEEEAEDLLPVEMVDEVVCWLLFKLVGEVVINFTDSFKFWFVFSYDDD
jgi:hypothetical protein